MSHTFRPQDTPGASFLPEDYVRRRAEVRANFISLGLFVVVMFGVAAAFMVTNRQWLTVRDEQRLVNDQYATEARKIEQLEQIEAQKAELIAKAELTTALIEKVPRSVLLSELVTRMPEEITLLNLGLRSKRIVVEGAPQPEAKKATTGSLSRRAGEKGKPAAKGKPSKDAKAEDKPKVVAPRFEYTLTINGVARVNNDVTDYLASLISCPLLEAVELAYIKSKTMDGSDLREFEITARIRPGADARMLATEAPGAGAAPDAALSGVPESSEGKE